MAAVGHKNLRGLGPLFVRFMCKFKLKVRSWKNELNKNV